MSQPRFQHSFNLDEEMEKRLGRLIKEHDVKIIDIIKAGIEKIEKETGKK